MRAIIGIIMMYGGVVWQYGWFSPHILILAGFCVLMGAVAATPRTPLSSDTQRFIREHVSVPR